MITYILFIIATWILIDQISHVVDENSKKIHYWWEFEFTYELSKKWTAFTYLFRSPYYRYRLHKRFRKCFYAPWETCDLYIHMCFELLSEYYIHGAVDDLNWAWEETHDHARKEIEELYIWWNADRPRMIEEIDVVLSTWSENYRTWWEDLDGEYSEFQCVNTKYSDYLFDLHDKLKEELEKQDEENLIRLIKIRNYLWT